MIGEIPSTAVNHDLFIFFFSHPRLSAEKAKTLTFGVDAHPQPATRHHTSHGSRRGGGRGEGAGAGHGMSASAPTSPRHMKEPTPIEDDKRVPLRRRIQARVERILNDPYEMAHVKEDIGERNCSILSLVVPLNICNHRTSRDGKDGTTAEERTA